jgi:hypothetical protein
MRAPLDLPSPGMGANNSFKPNLFRSSKSVAEKACHAFTSTTQVGLIQAIGLMSTVQSHPHKFRDSEWPFAVPQNALAIATKPVIEMGYPVLLVSHDDDGIWFRQAHHARTRELLT